VDWLSYAGINRTQVQRDSLSLIAKKQVSTPSLYGWVAKLKEFVTDCKPEQADLLQRRCVQIFNKLTALTHYFAAATLVVQCADFIFRGNIVRPMLSMDEFLKRRKRNIHYSLARFCAGISRCPGS